MKYRFTHSALEFALAAALLAPLAAWSRVSISVNIGPPPLLAYVQPPVPGDGYIWTPGYWAWSPRDHAYYWVPGTWVLAPAPGYLWTPGYWAFDGGQYLWHLGYWGTSVGFYGGINYGYGYGGYGYDGGRWNGSVFSYHRAYNNINPTVVRSVYGTRAGSSYRPSNAPHVSFNGGRGGVAARPSATQLQAQRATHTAPTPVQIEHERAALTTPTQKAAAVRGAARIAATPRPLAFTGPGVVHSRSAAAGSAAPATDTRDARDLQAPAVQAQPSARRAEQHVRSTPPAEQRAPREVRVERQVQQASRPERQAYARPPEAAAQPHAPRAERGQPRGHGEGHGKDKQRD